MCKRLLAVFLWTVCFAHPKLPSARADEPTATPACNDFTLFSRIEPQDQLREVVRSVLAREAEAVGSRCPAAVTVGLKWNLGVDGPDVFAGGLPGHVELRLHFPPDGDQEPFVMEAAAERADGRWRAVERRRSFRRDRSDRSRPLGAWLRSRVDVETMLFDIYRSEEELTRLVLVVRDRSRLLCATSERLESDDNARCFGIDFPWQSIHAVGGIESANDRILHLRFVASTAEGHSDALFQLTLPTGELLRLGPVAPAPEWRRREDLTSEYPYRPYFVDRGLDRSSSRFPVWPEDVGRQPESDARVHRLRRTARDLETALRAAPRAVARPVARHGDVNALALGWVYQEGFGYDAEVMGTLAVRGDRGWEVHETLGGDDVLHIEELRGAAPNRRVIAVHTFRNHHQGRGWGGHGNVRLELYALGEPWLRPLSHPLELGFFEYVSIERGPIIQRWTRFYNDVVVRDACFRVDTYTSRTTIALRGDKVGRSNTAYSPPPFLRVAGDWVLSPAGLTRGQCSEEAPDNVVAE